MKITRADIISIGLAIFSMLFGAGNLMYPLAVGRDSGTLLFYGMIGFIITTVLLPVAGLVAMILFDGDYESFFNRLGAMPGALLILASMLIIGPLIAIPRIVTLSHIMIAPFIPIPFLQDINIYSSFTFGVLFLGITFVAAFRENKIVDILGKFIAPALLISLIIIIGQGIISAATPTVAIASPFDLFKTNFFRGYEHLDLLGTIFFASIVITILKHTIGAEYNMRALTLIGFKAGILGMSLLGLVYIGMGILGVFHGHGLEYVHPAALFRGIAFNVLGGGAIVIGTAVLMACLSTSIALSAVVAEYTQHTIFRNNIDYVTALIIMLIASLPLSTSGIETVLQLTGGPIVYIGYPVIITLTFCNIAYKMFDFKPVKLPVLVALVIAVITYVW